MGGVGKTTLVKKVVGEAKGFDRVITVTVSETVNIEKLQNKIADDIDLNFEKNTEGGKATELWSRLRNGKFLVILDDLWNEWDDDGDLRKIGIPLVKDEKGCKIILTTRNCNVCQHMECEETVQVKVLEDDEAWALFEMNAGLKNADSRVIGEAKKIAKECKGLPLAIVTLAKALKGKALERWKDARKKLERSGLMEIPSIQTEREKNAYISLQISYEHLKDKMPQTCFLLYVKLHDIVRDVALWIASEEKSGFMIKSRLELLNRSSESCKAISLLDSEKKNFPNSLILSKLEILLLKNCNVQGTCFLEMGELKVLSLTVVDGSTGVISLYALSSLQNLRALHLENFDDFSFLGNSRKLEILSLRRSNVNGLADELERLKDLKMLDLTDCSFSSSFFPNVIRRLSQLEELYLSIMTNDICLAIKSLTRLTRLNLWVTSLHFPPDFEFPKLENYKIRINHSSSGLDNRFEEARSLKVEKVFPYNADSQLLGKLESVVVSGIKDEYVECLTNKTQQKVSVSMI
ncbi:probable disease resistance protein At5g43730 [Gossypium raimondii]|uniref:probable disease resistance protein At5g43730 n=1 Tax=Gossypium raimondii TaxID=29730 RepID=UPI00227BAE9A|nr:probable disease resistance protein At5g43730 [Gossypium raimondii]